MDVMRRQVQKDLSEEDFNVCALQYQNKQSYFLCQ